MLSKKRCRHTGVVNFFADDPHLPVGSAIKVGRRVGYHWRCYTDPCSGGGRRAQPQVGGARDRRALPQGDTLPSAATRSLGALIGAKQGGAVPAPPAVTP
jgi:hypothetical protein